MKAKLDKAWRKFREYAAQGGIAKWVGRLMFEKDCRDLLGMDVSIEWDNDGGCIVAGVIAFSLT